ncbi:MAG: D-alanine--D-alanine ligase [Dehalococcoidales bacterium]|nr:D-alanine--D-alanine ligase [Dehalococcoidales bacterium]MDZ4230472.1 D-alanine--D-alanine ligase [Dehalococcoidales bacterium]
MRIGLAYDLKEAIPVEGGGPDDALEEYDSAATVELIAAALRVRGHSVIMLGGGSVFLDNIRREKVDIVFNIAEGRGSYRSREAQVPAILEMLDIPYVGSDPQCLAICLDKAVTKKLVVADGIVTPEWRVITDGEELARISWNDFPFPAIIKPAYEGSSKGIRLDSIAHTAEQVTAMARKLLSLYCQPVMVEEFIAGDEITVGIVGNSPPEVVGLMRVLSRRNEAFFVYSVEVKRDWKVLVDYECPARVGEAVWDRISAASLKVFKTLGCRDFARLDFRVSREGIPYFLEVNPLPGLGTHSDLVIMAQKMGRAHQELICAVLDSALGRYPQCVRV